MAKLNHTPKIVVWMVTFNHESYIGHSIDSILNQKTTFEFKLLIGEDCSTDSTRQICKKYKYKYPKKIDLYLQNRNYGSNLNGIYMYEKCFKSGADYVALCEGDDYWTDPLKLQKQVDFLENNKDCSFCFHKASKFQEIDKKFVGDYPVGLQQAKYSAKDFFSIPTVPTCSVMFRNNIPISFLPHTHGDFQLYCQLLSRGLAGFIDETMAVYRLHGKGISATYNEEDYQKNRIKELIIEEKHPAYSIEVRSAIKNVLQNHLEHYLNNRRGKGSFLKKLRWYKMVFLSMYFISLPNKRKFRLLKSFVKSIKG